MHVFLKNDIRELKIEQTEEFMKFVNNQIEVRDTDGFNDQFAIFLFFQSICMVKQDYIEYNENYFDVQERNGRKGKRGYGTKKLYLERTFAYELYRIWQDFIISYMDNMRVDAEIGKKLTYDPIFRSKIAKMKGTYKIPDLVLHSSQGNTNNHTIICEIKRDEKLGRTGIKNDLIKLCRYMDKNIWDGNPYKFGCFILVSKDRDFDCFIKTIQLLKDDLIPFCDKVNFSRLLCLLYDGLVIKYESLDNILRL